MSKSNRSANQTFMPRQSKIVSFVGEKIQGLDYSQESPPMRGTISNNNNNEESKTFTQMVQERNEQNKSQNEEIGLTCVICGKDTISFCPCSPQNAYCSAEHQQLHWEQGHWENHDEQMKMNQLQQQQNKRGDQSKSSRQQQLNTMSDKEDQDQILPQDYYSNSQNESSSGHQNKQKRKSNEEGKKRHKKQNPSTSKKFADENESLKTDTDFDRDSDPQRKQISFAKDKNRRKEVAPELRDEFNDNDWNNEQSRNQDLRVRQSQPDPKIEHAQASALKKFGTMNNQQISQAEKSHSSYQGDAVSQQPLKWNEKNKFYEINQKQKGESKWVQVLILLAKQDYHRKLQTKKKQKTTTIHNHQTQETFMVLSLKVCQQPSANYQVIIIHYSHIKGSDVSKVEEVLNECEYYLGELRINVKDIKKQIQDAKKEKVENRSVAGDDRSSAYTKRLPNINRMRQGFSNIPTFADFKWMLSAFATIAAFYNALGNQIRCELAYVRYVQWIEKFFGKDSLEASNCYFLVGLYYFEQNYYQKSLACFIKSLYSRQKELGGDNHTACADCYLNIGILYKKLNVPLKALSSLEKALQIKKECIGSQSLPVAKILEELGKYHLEKSNYKQSYQAFQECYEIRKKILRKPDHEDVQKISCLLLYLSKNIEKELKEREEKQINQKNAHSIAGLSTNTGPVSSAKLATLSEKVKNIFSQQIQDNLDEDLDQEFMQGNSIASKVMQEIFQKNTITGGVNGSNLLNSGQKDRSMRKKEETKENEWYDQEFERAIQNYAKLSASQMNEDKEMEGKTGKVSQRNQRKSQLMNGLNASVIQPKASRKQAIEEEEDDVEKIINRGFDHYFNIVKTQLYEKVAPYLLAFLLSLSEKQMSFLQKCQVNSQLNAPLYIPNEFKEILNPFQLNLFNRSQIWKISRERYIKPKSTELNLSNLVQPEFNNKAQYRQQVQKDHRFLQLIQEIPEFLSTINENQRIILQNAIKNEILLKYFFISVSYEQLQEFEAFVLNQQQDAEYDEVLKELASQMPFQIKNSKANTNVDPLVKILDYKFDMCSIIDLISNVEVFRSIDIDLPDNYLNNATFTQIQRLTNIRRELERGNPVTKEIQSQFKKFIMDLDVKEAYEFSILNPFLLNEEELQNLINEIEKEEQELEQKKQGDMILDLNKIVDSSSSENSFEVSQDPTVSNYKSNSARQNDLLQAPHSNQQTLLGQMNSKALSFIRSSKQKLKGGSRKSLMSMDLERITQDLSSRALDQYNDKNNLMAQQNYGQLNMIKEHRRGSRPNQTESEEDSDDDKDMRQNFQMLHQQNQFQNFYN
ncbi:tpr domain containing protein [Stylonychia lemnae]|uniref:Tpr domain containing protein n=1 Tax=Stylonychia lemnae TaxID=5949 RepID=A0A077ZZ71_STYLE|nr:tpr domain containing protein [Stylonychia lemnae]|eukprot:CDW74513.1 tpr domain containing protein [Stylonychia lemnae]